MMYVSYISETGTIRESDVFKRVFQGALTEARGYLMDHPQETVLIRLTRADEIIDRHEGIYVRTERVNEETVAFVGVSRTGYTISFASGEVYDVDKEGR